MFGLERPSTGAHLYFIAKKLLMNYAAYSLISESKRDALPICADHFRQDASCE